MKPYALFLTTALVAQEPVTQVEFTQLHAQLVPKCAEAWQTIPWRTDLLVASREASVQKKLLFVWSMNGHPLGCT